MRLLATTVKVTAHAVDAVRSPDAGLVILIYHRIGARTPVVVDLPTPVFDDQMSRLAETGNVISLDDAVGRLSAGEDLTGHQVITFDDGTVDFVEDALPVLDEYDLPATLYVATRHIDEGMPFPDDGQAATWAALADAVSSGLVTIGSHTHSHALLDRLAPADVAAELDRSIELIGDKLGVQANHFAYPKALAPTPIADRAVRERFASAALAGTRANGPGSDVHRLLRSPIQTTDGSRWFGHKVAGGMRFEDDVRQMVNRRRYRGASA
jgi:peptidoglycan/xylan/chitin deacetylase (PgdA/CDA1 family)